MKSLAGVKSCMKKITKDWLDSANSDLLIIEQILSMTHLTHQMAFHAQQAIEKSFKAVIEEYELGFVKTHTLTLLYSKVHVKASLSLDKNLLILLDQLYIDSRYPGESGLLPNGKPSPVEAKVFFELAKAVYNNITKILQ